MSVPVEERRKIVASMRRFARLWYATQDRAPGKWVSAAWTNGCLIVIADARSIKAKRIAEFLESEDYAVPQRDEKQP